MQNPLKYILSLTLLFSVVSCSKKDGAMVNAVAGTWIFTSQQTASYPYPTVLTNPFPIGNSQSSASGDAIRIIFDNSGSFTFYHAQLPVDRGTYAIVQDSFLVIHPDSAAFIKFNYRLPSITFDTVANNQPVIPYQGFKFVTDTILFRKTGTDIVFSGEWLAPTNAPLIPSGDTIVLNQVLNFFKKG